jgi:hypothetical protein
LMNFLRMLGTDFLKRSVHFLENHDEERAMNVMGMNVRRRRPRSSARCPAWRCSIRADGRQTGTITRSARHPSA